jgi:DNA-binding transcriptional ArsR family regulator
VLDATDNADQIKEWWTRWPDANIGVATGKPSNIVVIDQDGMRAGLGLWKLQDERRDYFLNHTLGASTGRDKGFHFVFLYPDDGEGVPSSTGRIADGVDVKADGGYIVVDPSLHSSGKRYHWLNELTPLPMPGWFLRRARAGTKPVLQTVTTATTTIPKGRRNATLTQQAGVMRRYGFSADAIAAALKIENKTRCVPPLAEVEVIRIAESISRYAPTALITTSPTLTFRTAREVAEMTPESIPWVAKPWLAAGCVTEVDGKIKAAGKTTWLTHLCRAVLDGLPFMGEPTSKSPVVFLTEQSNTSFREALRRAQLLDREDLLILALHETVGHDFPAIMKETVDKALGIGAKLVVVDTLARWAKLRSDMENSAGDAAEAVRPLKEAASTHGLAVAFARHERKSGGPVGDSGRGSSAIGGEVDVILSIRRPSGGYAPNVRTIESLSRFDETPDSVQIELIPGIGYIPIASSLSERRGEAAEQLLEVLPVDGAGEMTMNELEKATGKPRTTLQRTLDALEGDGLIVKRRDPGPKSPMYYCQTGTPSEASAEDSGGDYDSNGGE